MFGGTPTSTPNNDFLNFRSNKNNNSKNYSVSEFIPPEDKALFDKDQTFKRKINFEELPLSATAESISSNTTTATKIAKNISIDVEDKNNNINVPYTPALDLKTPPHFKFNQLKNISSSFASCFAHNSNDIYRPISTTHIAQNENIFRYPNESKKKPVTVEDINNKTNINLNEIENNKFKESSGNALSQKLTKIVCNCKKSKCLKLYCECFILGLYCDGCNCSPCFNNVDNSEERNKVMELLKEKNPAAFKPKIDYNIYDDKNKVEKTKHIRGCNCRQTQCLKKYCECYQSSVLCTSLCKCTDCKNDDIEKLKKKVKNNVIFKTVTTSDDSLDNKNSFSHEFFPNKDISIKDQINSTNLVNRKDISEENSDYEDDIEIEDFKRTSHYKSPEKNLERKRKRPPSEDFVAEDLNDEILTPKNQVTTFKTKRNKDVNNTHISTGPGTSKKKRVTKLSGDSDEQPNKIAKKLNLQF